MNKTVVIIIGIALAIGLIIGAFIWYLSFTSYSDLSEDIRFAKYINKPLIVKQPSALKYNLENMNRFSAYYIDNYDPNTVTSENNILKIFSIGDTIIFKSAKGYYSNHVGQTYYLIGEEKLVSGEIIKFEYYAGFDYTPAIWETMDVFLERRKLENKLPQ